MSPHSTPIPIYSTSTSNKHVPTSSLQPQGFVDSGADHHRHNTDGREQGMYVVMMAIVMWGQRPLGGRDALRHSTRSRREGKRAGSSWTQMSPKGEGKRKGEPNAAYAYLQGCIGSTPHLPFPSQNGSRSFLCLIYVALFFLFSLCLVSYPMGLPRLIIVTSDAMDTYFAGYTAIHGTTALLTLVAHGAVKILWQKQWNHVPATSQPLLGRDFKVLLAVLLICRDTFMGASMSTRKRTGHICVLQHAREVALGTCGIKYLQCSLPCVHG